MFYFSVIISCTLVAWLFGIFQRINMLARYNKIIDASDYLHVAISLGTAIMPLIYFYSTGNVGSFLAGFAFAYIISTVCSFCLVLLLASSLIQNPLDTKALTIYSVFMSAPSTIVILGMGIFLKNPFVIGSACAVASSWIGYLAKLNDQN